MFRVNGSEVRVQESRFSVEGSVPGFRFYVFGFRV